MNTSLHPGERAGRFRFLQRLIRWGSKCAGVGLALVWMVTTPQAQEVEPLPDPATPPVTPAPATPAAMPVTATVDVSVTRGTGSGLYAPGQMVTVAADSPFQGQSFLGWTGDVGALSDPFARMTTLTVPNRPVSLTASYGIVVENKVIDFTSHRDGDFVDEKGFTVLGTAFDKSGLAGLTVTVQIDGQGPVPGMVDRPLAFGARTGQWAVRLFDEDVPPASTVTITLRARNSGSEISTASLRLTAAAISHENVQLLNRITFGATPAMMDDITKMGFDKFLRDQIRGARKVENKVDTDEDVIKKVKPQKFFTKWRDYENEKIRQLMRERLSYLAFSENQLREVMALFWDNHFNTTAVANDDFYGELMEMRAFREAALGPFRELLSISARSTVMMNYLNNNTSRAGALNENYGRELLELHTVGVDAGYTTEDVIQVARIFTGWSEDLTKKAAKERNKKRKKPRHDEREFTFVAEDHDTDFKEVPYLARVIQGSGAFDPEKQRFSLRSGTAEGDELLDILALHPDTAGFICTKLVEHFVSDTPPDSLVTSCAADYLASDGHIGTVLETILTSSEFRSDPANYRSKFKSPTEYVIGLVRHFGFSVEKEKKVKKSEILNDALDDMTSVLANAGMAWFRYPVPTGFDDQATDWATSTSMLQRFQYALRMPHGGQDLIEELGLETPEAIAAVMMDRVMGGFYSRAEYETVVDALYGNDGTFDITGDEFGAIERGFEAIAITPNYQIQ